MSHGEERAGKGACTGEACTGEAEESSEERTMHKGHRIAGFERHK